jgi:hypothetical chaperone protein
LQALIGLIADEQGFALYQAVSAVKMALSREGVTELRFSHGALEITETIHRSAFEAWIGADLARMAAAIDSALVDGQVGPGDIDQVFLTGGTSFVPAVQRLFADRFGEERLTAGGELVSVAEGLALIGAERKGV